MTGHVDNAIACTSEGQFRLSLILVDVMERLL